MTDELTIYGYSDDSIIVEGAVKEQIYIYGESYLFLDNGLIVEAEYEGDWNLRVVERGGSESVEVISAGSSVAEEVAGRDYTDVIRVKSAKISQVAMAQGKIEEIQVSKTDNEEIE